MVIGGAMALWPDTETALKGLDTFTEEGRELTEDTERPDFILLICCEEEEEEEEAADMPCSWRGDMIMEVVSGTVGERR